MIVDQINDDLYRLKEVLPVPDLFRLGEEFDNYGLQLKKEYHSDDNALFQPFLGIEKSGGSLGDNIVLLHYGTVCRLKAESVLGKKLDMWRVNTNLQFRNQEADFHQDGDDRSWTLLIFTTTTWNGKWGGEFTITLRDGDYRSIPYLPNQGVLFRGSLEHRGCAPNVLAQEVRTSVAFTYQEAGG